jgi:hypothetical protein
LHGRNIGLVEGIRSGRENLEDPQCPAEMAQWSRQNGAHTKAMTTGQIDLRIALRVMAQDHLSCANTLSGDAGIGLQTNAEIRCSTTGAGSTDDLIPLAQRNGSACGPGQTLGPFRNDMDSRLEIDFYRVSASIAQNIALRAFGTTRANVMPSGNMRLK